MSETCQVMTETGTRGFNKRRLKGKRGREGDKQREGWTREGGRGRWQKV